MAGGGGGAWKVAYADFVTAMMALFLVLWILSQDEKIKGDVQQYFRTKYQSATKQSVGIIPIENADLIRAKRAHFDNAAAIPLEQVRRINDDLKRVFAQTPNEIDMNTMQVKMTDEGLLIEFYNNPSRRLFQEGDAKLTPFGKVIFQVVAWTLAKHDNRKSTLIEIEGHTNKDFERERGKNNEDKKWTVSTARALAVRKFMAKEGVTSGQFNKVTGYGSKKPHSKFIKSKNHHSHNRVSIMVKPGTVSDEI